MPFTNRIIALIDESSPAIGIYLRFIKQRLNGNRELDIARRFIQPGNFAIDVGARKGIYSWVMSGLVGNKGKVAAFEPNPQNVRTLRRVFSGKSNIVIHDCALSDHTGEELLYVPMVVGELNDAFGHLEKRDEDGPDSVLYRTQV